MPQNRPIIEHGQEPFTLFLKVGRNDDTGRVFKIGRSLHNRHQDVFNNIAHHDQSCVQTTGNTNVIGVVMPAAEGLIIKFLLRILTSEGKARLTKGTPERVLFKLAKVCQVYNCTDQIRSMVDWSTAPEFAAEDERDGSCQPEEIYFIAKQFHLPKVLLIGWTRFINRVYVQGGLKIHSRRWHGLESRDLSRGGRDPMWELLEGEDTKSQVSDQRKKNCTDSCNLEYTRGVARERIILLYRRVRGKVIRETGSSCQVRFAKYGRNPKGKNECQNMRIDGIYELCHKLDIQSWESPDSEEDLHRELGVNSIELLSAALIKGSRFELNAQHARCEQPRDLLYPMLDELLRSVPEPTPKLRERLMSLGDDRFANRYWR